MGGLVARAPGGYVRDDVTPPSSGKAVTWRSRRREKRGTKPPSKGRVKPALRREVKPDVERRDDAVRRGRRRGSRREVRRDERRSSRRGARGGIQLRSRGGPGRTAPDEPAAQTRRGRGAGESLYIRKPGASTRLNHPCRPIPTDCDPACWAASPDLAARVDASSPPHRAFPPPAP